MKMRVEVLQPLIVLIASLYLPIAVLAQTIPGGPAVDAEVNKIMTETHANGMAVAVIDHARSAIFTRTASVTPREIR